VQRFSQFAFLILLVIICFVGASDAVFRASSAWMCLESSGFHDAAPRLADLLIQLAAIVAFGVGVIGLVIGLRRRARAIAWSSLGLMLVGPTVAIFSQI